MEGKDEVKGEWLMLSEKMRKAVTKRGFGSPTRVQSEGIPQILSGANVLLMAPTGTGKTETTLLPIFDMWLQNEQKPISILYITPLKSLNRDLQKRINWWAKELDMDASVRHGDTTQYERGMQTENPPDMLIATPEALQSLLVGRRMRQHLSNVRWVVIDEVHEIVASKRGVQLSVALERLKELIKASGNPHPQIIGLSATVGTPKDVAAYITGGSDCVIVDTMHLRGLRLSVEAPKPTDEDYRIAPQIFMTPQTAARVRRISEIIREKESVLAFTNTRESAEVISSRLKVYDEQLKVETHHSSLSKDFRIKAEEGFKSGEVKALVCIGKNSRILSSDGGWNVVDAIDEAPRMVSVNSELKAEAGAAKAVACNGKKKLFKLTSNLGFEIEATRKHKFLTIDGDGNMTWTRLDRLNGGPLCLLKKSIKGRRKSFYDMLPDDTYAEFSTELLSKLKLHATKKFKTFRALERAAGCPRGTFSRLFTRGGAVKLGMMKGIVRELGMKCNISDYVMHVGSGNYARYVLPKHVTPNFSRFVGFLLSDGTITRNDMLRLFNKRKHILDNFREILKNEFEIDSSLLSGPNCFVLQSHATWLASVLGSAGVIKGRKARDVRIPDFIFTLPERQRFGFISGYFDGDGNIEAKGGRLVSIIFNTYSIGMARDLQMLLLSLGIVSSLRDRSKRNRGCSVAIIGGKHIQRFVRNCCVWKANLKGFDLSGGYSNLDTIPNLGRALRGTRLRAGLTTYGMQKDFGINPEKYEIGTRTISRRNLRRLLIIYSRYTRIPKNLWLILGADLFFDRVKSIEPCGCDYVYDVINNVNKNFIANGFVVHNCTSSLELGIDIGSIDFIIQFMSPRQAGKLLQRLGRSGHTSTGVSDGVIISSDPDDCFESAAIARLALEGRIEPSRLYGKSLDVLMHQIAGLSLEEYMIPAEKAYGIIRRAHPFRELTRDDFQSACLLLEKLGFVWLDYASGDVGESATAGKENHTRPADGELTKSKETTKGAEKFSGIRLKRRKKSWEYYFQNMSTIPDSRNYKVLDVVSNQFIGTLDAEFMALHGAPGTGFIVKGQAWRILEVLRDRVMVEPMSGVEAAIPAWVGELIPVPAEVARLVGDIRLVIWKMLKEGRKKADIRGHVMKECPVDDDVFDIMFSAMKKQDEAPADASRIIIEHAFADGINTVVINSCFGSLINETLGRVVADMLTLRFGSVGLQSDPYRIVLRMQEGKAEDVARTIRELKPEQLRPILDASLPNTELFQWRFVHVAQRTGVIRKDADFGKFYLRRVIDGYKGTPVFAETLHEIYTEKLDIAGAEGLLRLVAEGRVGLELRQGLSHISRLGIMPRHEVVAQDKPDAEIFRIFKDRLFKTKVRLLCTQCGSAVNYVVENLPQEVRCVGCKAKMLGVIHPDDMDSELLVNKHIKGRELSAEDQESLDKITDCAAIVASSGRDAVVAMAGRGVGPRAAARILRRPGRGDEFLKDILREEQLYSRNKRFWR